MLLQDANPTPSFGGFGLSQRRVLHKSVAGYLVQETPDRVQEIARHYLEAREESLAVPYVVAAGDAAAGAYSTDEAMSFYRQAIEILEKAGDTALTRRAYEGLGSALTFAFKVPEAIETYHDMFHVAQEVDDKPMQVSALNKLGYVSALMQGQFPEAENHLADAERLADEAGDMEGLAEMHMTYCYLRSTKGEFDDAADHLGKAAQIGLALDMEEPKLFGLTHTANTMIYMNRYEDAWKAIQEARDAAEAEGNRKYLSELLAEPIPAYHLRNGDLDAAMDSAEEGTAMATEIGAMSNVAAGELIMAQIAWMRGEYERAVQLNQLALNAGRASGYPYLQAGALCALGTAYLAISKEYAEQVAEFHTEAMQVMEMPLGTALGAMAWADLGFCAMTLGDLEGAREMFQKGLDTPTIPTQMLRPRLLMGLAIVELTGGRSEEASEFARQARGLAEAAEMRHYYPYLALTEAGIRSAQGQAEQAMASFALAEELGLEMGLRPVVMDAREGWAQLLAASGRTEEAENKSAEARHVADDITALFGNDALRAKYLASAATTKVGSGT